MLSVLNYIGELKPYLPSNDDTIMLLLLLCFIIISITLARNKKLFLELGANLFNRSSKASYTNTASLNVADLLPLVVQTCITIGILVFVLLDHNFPHNIINIETWIIIGVGSILSLAYIGIKWVAYSFIGWVFNAQDKIKAWIETYTAIIYYLGVILYIFVLLIVYSNIAVNTILYILFGLLVLTKCLILYRWLKLFPKKSYGHILLILYFCALEIIPYAILYSVMTRTIMF